MSFNFWPQCRASGSSSTDLPTSEKAFEGINSTVLRSGAVFGGSKLFVVFLFNYHWHNFKLKLDYRAHDMQPVCTWCYVLEAGQCRMLTYVNNVIRQVQKRRTIGWFHGYLVHFTHIYVVRIF